MRAFGIDIGGSGIKGGEVDLTRGELIGERQRLDTPQPSTPEAVMAAVGQLVAEFDPPELCGITFPGVVQHGTVLTAANVDLSWVGVSLEEAASAVLPGKVKALNDADAAGLAEVRFGAGRDRPGLTIMLTLGTGIGSAIFNDGVLVPNSEFGHFELNGKDAEKWAAPSVRERKGLSWEEWAERLNVYLKRVEDLMWPDLLILGGGVSKKPEKWLPLLQTRTELVVAQLQNNAGIIGAALVAAEDIVTE